MKQGSTADAGGRRTLERNLARHAADEAPAILPTPMTGRKPLDVLERHALMEDGGSRCSWEFARMCAGFDEATSATLITKFRFRLRNTPFTDVGLLSQSEVGLLDDVWDALTPAQRTRIEYVTRENVAKKRLKSAAELPDQTPYAKRLAYRAIHWMANAK